MKKVIVSSSNESVEGKYSFVENSNLANTAYHAGYVLSGSPESLKITAKGDAEFMPEISANPEVEDGVVYYNPSIKFPEFHYDSDSMYPDTIEYYMSLWQKAAELVTALIKNPVDLDEWR